LRQKKKLPHRLPLRKLLLLPLPLLKPSLLKALPLLLPTPSRPKALPLPPLPSNRFAAATKSPA